MPISLLLICGGLSLVLSLILLRIALSIAHKRKLYDSFNARKLHTQPIPRLGGIAFIPALLLGIEGCRLLYPEFFAQLYALQSEAGAGSVLYPLSAIICLYIVGFIDDIWEIGAGRKFLSQMLAVALLFLGDYEIYSLWGILALEQLSPMFSLPLTCLVFLLVINATNLIDGVDGLASGICISAFTLYAFLFYQGNSYGYMLLSFAGIAALLPFVYFNVFGSADKKTKIFMGDTGSLSLGLLLCILSGQAFKLGGDVFSCDINPLILAFSPLYLPAFDVIRVFSDRLGRGISPFTAEKNHIHHYFIGCGLNHRQTTASLMLISLILSIGISALSCYVEPTLLLIGSYGLWCLVASYMKRLAERKLHDNIAVEPSRTK